jgi:hypothetical protein
MWRQRRLTRRPAKAQTPGERPLCRARELVASSRTESVWLRSDRPSEKVGGEGSTEAALTDASMASGVVLPATAAGAAPGTAGALGLRAVCRDGAAVMVGAAAAGVAALVRPGGVATGALDWRAGAAG